MEYITDKDKTNKHSSKKSISKKKTAGIIIFIIYILVVGFLCFGKFPSMPNIQKTFLGIEKDKIVHFIMFFPFPILLYLTTGARKMNNFQAIGFVVLSLVLGSVLAGISEYIQHLIPYRSCDIKDFEADTMAIATCAMFLYIYIFKHNRLEHNRELEQR